MTTAPAPRTAFFADQPCQLVSYHAPEPVMTEHHHQHPVYMQQRLYGRIVDGPSLWVCSNCHDSVHAWVYWLTGERHQPQRIGRAAKAEAERTYEWWLSELAAKA